MRVWLCTVTVAGLAGGIGGEEVENLPPQILLDIHGRDISELLLPWHAKVSAEDDPTYLRIILPWLEKHGPQFPAQGDGLLVVYQPWGFVSRARLYQPGDPEGTIIEADNDGQSVKRKEAALAAADWAALRTMLLEGKFFDLPYRNDKLGMDGASVYVEARIDGKHHRVCHWQPDHPLLKELQKLAW